MGFEDLDIAAKMRDTIERIAISTVNRMRPDTRIGKVFSFDQENKRSQILFAGETVNSLVTVSVSGNLYPQVTMDASFDDLEYDAPGDIVRIAGKPGAYYISGFISGQPQAVVRYPSEVFTDAFTPDPAVCTLIASKFAKAGAHVQFGISISLVNPTTDSPNFTNVVLGTVKPEWIPVIAANTGSAGTGQMVAGFLSITSELVLSSSFVPVPATQVVDLYGNYILASGG